MAAYNILYWQDIPSVIEAKDGSAIHKIQLSQRFQELIDAVAMRKGLAGTDAYLEEWRRGEPVERDGSAEQVANAVREELEAQFEALKASALAKR
jgi:hypothetical protein